MKLKDDYYCMYNVCTQINQQSQLKIIITQVNWYISNEYTTKLFVWMLGCSIIIPCMIFSMTNHGMKNSEKYYPRKHSHPILFQATDPVCMSGDEYP